MATRIDGRAVSKNVRQDLTRQIGQWTNQGHRAPFLAVVLVGDDPASASYVRSKKKAAANVGIESEIHRYAADVSEEEVLEVVDTLNADDSVDGILVQMPLPDHVDAQRVIHRIRPEKDVDGLHPENAGRLLTGADGFVPATPLGILELIRRTGTETEGARAVVVGRSTLVGKPMAALFLRRSVNATVTVCHSRTRNLGALTREADILVAAVGRAHVITAEMVKDGATVIDVGINRVEDESRDRGYRLTGDVDYEEVAEKAGAITPVPGGVGPMTIAMMLRNTYHAAAGTYYPDASS